MSKNKNKLVKIIPYIVMLLGLVSAIWSYYIVQNFENTCNEHLIEQMEKVEEQFVNECSEFTGIPDSNKYFEPNPS